MAEGLSARRAGDRGPGREPEQRRSAVFTATVKTAAGPRIVDSDQGTVNSPVQLQVTDPATLLPKTLNYNNRFTADGYRIIDGFTITFDRPVDVSTFSPEDVTVLFRDPNTPLGTPGSVIPVDAVIPLDTQVTFRSPTAFPDNATKFFVRFTTPQMRSARTATPSPRSSGIASETTTPRRRCPASASTTSA